jgi:hypothetical protein
LSYVAQALVPAVCGMVSENDPISSGNADNACSLNGAPVFGNVVTEPEGFVGVLLVTIQSPGLLANSVCFSPLIAPHSFWST